MIKDYMGKDVHVGDLVAISTTNGIRVGRVLKINTYTSDAGDTTYTVQIMRELGDGTTKRATLDYRQDNFYLVKRIKVRVLNDKNTVSDTGFRVAYEF